MLPKIARVAWLYSYYGKLLTPKQQLIIELYYEQDLSLGEIAEEQGISRQAVHDIIRRAEATLEEYEQKLGILAKSIKQQEILQEVLNLLDAGEKDPAKISQAKAKIKQLLSLIEEKQF